MTDRSGPLSAFEQARARARDAGVSGDWPQAARWAERAWRLADRRPLPSLELAAILARTGDRRATGLLARAAKAHADFPVLIALAAAQNRDGAYRAAQATLHRLLTTAALDVLSPVSELAREIAARAGLAGWLGWRNGRLVFGAAYATPDMIDFALDHRVLVLDWTPEAPQVWSAALPQGASGRLCTTPPLLGTPLRPELFGAPAGSATRSATGVQGWVWFPHDPGRQPAVTVTVSRRGRSYGITTEDLALAAPTDTAPFARCRVFDVPLGPGAIVLGVKEAGSGQAIPLGPASREAAYVALAKPPDVASLLERCRTRPCVVLVTHDEGGGIERHVRRRLDALRRAGKRGLLLRSRRDRPGAVLFEQIAFQLPADGPALLDLMRQIRLVGIEYHHLRRHEPFVWQLAASLGVPYDVHLHDYALLCPRVTLIDSDGRYCGEPPVAQCERCVSLFEHRRLFAPKGVAALRRQSAALLAEAQTVRAPSADIATRFRHHMPAVAVTIRPWEATQRPASPAHVTCNYVHVCVVGALNRHKGLGVLLDCARDAAIRRLPLRFTVVGYTSDDDALIGAGVFVTGPYAEAERAELIARQQATIGFLPSIWPEPWCYALTGLLEAGLPTLCFDIGAQAERVRMAGGSVLPLGTLAEEINQQLIKMSRLTFGFETSIV